MTTPIIPKAIIQPRIQYTSKTFEDVRQQLINIVQTTPGLKDKWTDFNESDLGMALLELWCAISDELNFFLDNQANEAFWLTSRQRKSVISLAKLIAYKLDTSVSSAGTATFRWVSTVTTSATSPVFIPKYTRLQTSGGTISIPFVTVAATTLAQGSATVDVPIIQGILHEEQFTATNSPDQSFILGRTDVASNFGAIEVLVGQGDDLTAYETWIEAVNFIIKTPEDNQKIFTVTSDHLDRTIITFGDGVFGQIPPDGFTIVVHYLESLGSVGNTGPLSVSSLVDPLADFNGIPVGISVFNTEACVGGADRESIEHAKKQAPLEFAALFRAVTRIDGTALVNGFAGISKAGVWGEQELPHPDLKHFNQMYTTFLAEGIVPTMGEPVSWLPTTTLKNDITAFLEDRKVITTNVNFVDPEFVFIDVQLDMYIDSTASVVAVKQAVTDKLNEFFSLSNRDFGQDVRFSNLTKELDNLSNVDHLSIKLRRNGVHPSRSDTFGGVGITITGTGFQAGATVMLGQTPATSVVVVNDQTITCTVPASIEPQTVDVIVTNPDTTTYIIRKGFIYTAGGVAPVETTGAEPNPDEAQFNFNEQDIILRRNEIAALGVISAADGTDNIMHYSKDDEPIHARITFTPLYGRIGDVTTFDGTGSGSPNADIQSFTWNMGARGTLMVRQADGTIIPSGNQPSDRQTVATVFSGGSIVDLRSSIMWRFEERPSTGWVTVVLTVMDTYNTQAAEAVSYEIKL